MSTSFPNNNGNVPPYNSQANGSFNQFGQGAPPPGAFPGMDQYHHHQNMYPNANGYGGMPTGQPNMGGPPQQPPGGAMQKPHQPPQYPGAGAPGGVKLPGYDANPMQNGYMGFPPQRPGMPAQNGQNGPPPNYNGHHQMPPNNQYPGVPDPYRMYSGMPGPPHQPPGSQNSMMPQRPSSTQNSAATRTPTNPAPTQQYPAQQPLPAHLHGTPQFPGMPPPAGSNAPLQHYQPNNFGNNTPPVRGGALPSLQPQKTAKPENETRPNDLSANAYPANNPQFPSNYGGPSGSGTPGGFESFGGAPGGYPGYPGGPGGPGSHGNPSNSNSGTPGNAGTPGMNGANAAPKPFGAGFNNSPYGANGPNPSGAGPLGGMSNPYAPNPHSNSNMPGTSGSYGGPPGGMMNGAHPQNPAGRATPGTPNTPGTPGAQGKSQKVPTPQQQQQPPQQSQSQFPPGMPHQMPPFNQNNLMSPSQNGPPKHPANSPMGSALQPLNGQYPPLNQPMQQSPVNPSPNMERPFKEPAMPVRQSPMQSPAHPPPSGQPPAYTAPSNPKAAEPSTSTQPPRPHSPTFAVPTLPAAATLAQASSANQVSTKPKTSPQKKKGFDTAPEPPGPDTPFTIVNGFEMPAALTVLRDTLSKSHPQLEKMYFARKRQQLRVPYPEGVNAHTAPVLEPDTFGFMQNSKYFDPKYNRMISNHPPMGPPMLARSQSMHAPMISPSFNSNQPSTSGTGGSGRQPAKKARSASDASEPPFNVPLPPSRQPPGMRPADPRLLQQMQMNHYQQQQMHHQQQMQKMQMAAAHQQQMARMGQAPGPSGPGGISPAAGSSQQLPPLAAPSLQRADSMPQLPTQQQPPMGGGMPPASMPPHMTPQPNGNPEGQTVNTNTNNTGPSNNAAGLPPLSLESPAQAGTQNHEYPAQPASSSQVPNLCSGCHHFISPGSSTLCCMYHDCKNVYHRECTRLSPSAFTHFAETPRARWVCPSCECQVRPMPMQTQHS